MNKHVLSVANLVVTKGNTLLSDAEVEMLAILRINRRFMEFMRANYPDLPKKLATQSSSAPVGLIHL